MSNDNFTIKPSLINAWSVRLAEQVPFCPCPPETLDCAVKSDLSKVDGGILLLDCSVCHEPVGIDQFNDNGGACNFCYHELSNDSYLKSFDLERRLL